MAHLKKDQSVIIINGRTLTERASGDMTLSGVDNRASLTAGEEGSSVTQYSKLTQKYTVTIMVLSGSDDDAFLLNVFNTKAAVTGRMSLSFINAQTGNTDRTKICEFYNGVIVKPADTTDNLDGLSEEATISRWQFEVLGSINYV